MVFFIAEVQATKNKANDLKVTHPHILFLKSVRVAEVTFSNIFVQDEHQDPESNLGFLNDRNRLPLTADRHPDFQPPVQIIAPLQDHSTRSIVNAGTKTVIPVAARGHFAVTALQNHQRNNHSPRPCRSLRRSCLT